MKKNLKQNEGEERKPRRLVLHRETIQRLENPGLLELARGGVNRDPGGATSSTVNLC